MDFMCSGKPQCLFNGLGRCHDLISSQICNNHAAMFGLIFKTDCYTNAIGNSWERVNAYALHGHTIDIPLFSDRSGHIILAQVHKFARKVSNKWRDIKFELLVQRIGMLFGITATGVMALSEDLWLARPNTQVKTFIDNSVKEYYNRLPRLHCILFNDVRPSTIISDSQLTNTTNELANRMIISIPNLILEEVSDPDFGRMFRFVLTNPSNVLTMTTKSCCIATPLILDAIRFSNPISVAPNPIAFQPVIMDCNNTNKNM